MHGVQIEYLKMDKVAGQRQTELIPSCSYFVDQFVFE